MLSKSLLKREDPDHNLQMFQRWGLGLSMGPPFVEMKGSIGYKLQMFQQWDLGSVRGPPCS